MVLLLDKKTEVEVKAVSDIISKKFPCFFKLDLEHIPHLTLLHADINDEDLKKIIVCVENIANSNKLISVMPQDLRRGFMFRTLIGVYFKDDSEILTLRQKTLDKIGKYLLNLTPPLNPHVTITRLKKDEDVDSAISEIKGILQDKFVFPAIGICKIGENGTCTSVIKSMLLLSS